MNLFRTNTEHELCFENTLERGHPARLSRRNATYVAGRMPALQGVSWFLGARQPTGMSDCSENACAAGTLECGGLTPPSHHAEGRG
jgi:hypothetical protein